MANCRLPAFIRRISSPALAPKTSRTTRTARPTRCSTCCAKQASRVPWPPSPRPTVPGSTVSAPRTSRHYAALAMPAGGSYGVRKKSLLFPDVSKGPRPLSTREHDMRVPAGLQELLDEAIIDEVVRQLKSGKEASVYAVRCGAEIR